MMRRFTDMMGNRVVVNDPPKRIVSVVPSQTELLYDLGLDDEVLGITKFCVHPEAWFRKKSRVGGTKKLDLHKIAGLQPDLIIANKEENTREDIEALASKFPVWVSDIHTVAEALGMITAIGEITGKDEAASEMAQNVQAGFDALKRAAMAERVAYFIWYKPWMTVGRDTFINSIIENIGWTNIMSNEVRYPEIALDELRSLQPDRILLSSEPFPFKEKHMEQVKAVLPDTRISLVDGEMFSWYGSRMLKAIPYLQELVSEN